MKDYVVAGSVALVITLAVYVVVLKRDLGRQLEGFNQQIHALQQEKSALEAKLKEAEDKLQASQDVANREAFQLQSQEAQVQSHQGALAAALAAENKKLQDLLRQRSDLQNQMKNFDPSGLNSQIDQDNKRLKDLDSRAKDEQKTVKMSQQDSQAALKAAKAQQAQDNQQMRDAIKTQKNLVQDLTKQYQAVNRNRFDFNRTTKMNDLQQQVATQQATLAQMQSDFERAQSNQRAELDNIQNSATSETQNLSANAGQTQSQRDSVVSDLKRLTDLKSKLGNDRTGLESSMRNLNTAIAIEQQKIQSIQDQIKASATGT